MLKRFLVLCVLTAFVAPQVLAEDTLIWQSPEPTGHVAIHDQVSDRVVPCFATIRQQPDGSRYTRAVDCPGEGAKYSDIGVPAGGSIHSIQNQDGIHETGLHKARTIGGRLILK